MLILLITGYVSYIGKGFLVPVILGGLLATLFVPLCAWFEKKGINRGLAALFCVLIFLIAISGTIAVMSWQVAGIANDADKLTAQLYKIPYNFTHYLQEELGFSLEEQQKMIGEQRAALSSKIGAVLAGFAGSTLSILGNFLLVTIYTFLFIFYRGHLAAFVLKLVPENGSGKAEKIMASGSTVAQKYISGLGMMIGILWVMYGIGFSIVGIRHALFFAVLCGLLEIVPYIGNLTGSLLTALMAYTQGGSNMALWVLAVYLVVQFTQTYLLEPMVVGANVSINPLCTILAIILGEMIWGVPGMVLAIPLLGVIKIVCDNVPALQPFGFLIGVVKEKKKKPARAE